MEKGQKKIIQINANGKKYFCSTAQEQQIFTENNPGVRTETFNLEMPTAIANGRLNAPGNKEQFAKQVKE